MSVLTNKKEKVLVDFEEKMSLSTATTYFETIAQKLKEEGAFTLHLNGEPIEIKPSSQVELEIKVEVENNKKKFEIELEWVEGAEEKTLTIE